MSKNGTILIIFAWAMEIVGVTGGAINSIYTTFGDNLPNTVWGYVPAVPMAALAMAEFGRVSLASTIFSKHKLIQGIAVLGILALGYIAIENWTFGFERIVDLRLNSVKAASSELSRAEAELSALVEQQKRTANSNEQKREELRRGIEKRTASIAEKTAQRNNEDEAHRKNLQEIREACLRIRAECLRTRSLEEDARYKRALEQLSAELARQGREREELQSQIDALVVTDNTKVAELDQKVSIAERTVIESRKSLRSAADGNQIYRLAASWYGVSASEVNAEQAAKARGVFSTFSAVAVALAGTVAALVYYARSRVPGVPSFLSQSMAKLLRARQAYYARKRRPLKVEVPGPERVTYRDGKEPPIVIEKEVIRWIDRIVLIPRWGIRIFTYINAFFERNLHPKTDDPTDSTSNVTQLKKKVN